LKETTDTQGWFVFSWMDAKVKEFCFKVGYSSLYFFLARDFEKSVNIATVDYYFNIATSSIA